MEVGRQAALTEVQAASTEVRRRRRHQGATTSMRDKDFRRGPLWYFRMSSSWFVVRQQRRLVVQ
ncbi:hypothetical protein DEO72_LG1g2757 [Vigna unguiculata]|uniref:Uncharacterized protein n=1 Tax=Vigna unguiculata TaxID=3917 RepID=A0A4D6KM29_VIGUN|nr:hypothetical protein DEO72_LG1g2755 [Vigna unguiculata]QCD79118.1 hypothetical protein DEO72_LG1g2757 [Vigna unguiculata]